jgi:hypothetical protein
MGVFGPPRLCRLSERGCGIALIEHRLDMLVRLLGRLSSAPPRRDGVGCGVPNEFLLL